MIVNRGTELARLQAFQRHNATVQQALDRAATEMATGITTDLTRATAGDLARLHAMERALDRNEALAVNIVLVEQRLDVTQSALEKIHTALDSVAVDLATSVGQNSLNTAMMHADKARGDFIDAVSALNTQVAGRSIFAGTGTDRPALEDGDGILAQLDALVVGAPDAATVIATIEEYFRKDPAPSGAFYGAGYVGPDESLQPVEIAENRSVAGAVRADDAELVAVLKSQALAAVISGGALAGNTAEQLAVLDEAGTQMIAAREDLLAMRALLGMQQQTVENAQAGNTAEASALQIARAETIGIDPADAASRFQAFEAQLEAAYTVTARLGALRFANYMR
jgi:flagellar hook-associated protein 3 FlgL